MPWRTNFPNLVSMATPKDSPYLPFMRRFVLKHVEQGTCIYVPTYVPNTMGLQYGVLHYTRTQCVAKHSAMVKSAILPNLKFVTIPPLL